MSEPNINLKASRANVLGEAVLNAGAALGLSLDDVGRVVGRNRTTIVRSGIDPALPNGQLALLLVRLYRGLYALVGGDDKEMIHWMRTRIRSLQAVPAEMIFDVSGLVRLVEYVDAIRGKA